MLTRYCLQVAFLPSLLQEGIHSAWKWSLSLPYCRTATSAPAISLCPFPTAGTLLPSLLQESSKSACKEFPNVLSRCHAKRRTGARGNAFPSSGMTPSMCMCGGVRAPLKNCRRWSWRKGEITFIFYFLNKLSWGTTFILTRQYLKWNSPLSLFNDFLPITLHSEGLGTKAV